MSGMDIDTPAGSSAAAAASSSAAASSTSSSAASAPPRHVYAVTAHPATAVTCTAVCHFTSRLDLNLIVAKTSRLEIFRATADGLEQMHEVAMYGRMLNIIPFRARGDATDRLFITTERQKFFVLVWDAATKELKTVASGDSKLKIGRLSENFSDACIDPTGAWLGICRYDGLFQFLGINPNSGDLDSALYDVKLDQLQVIQTTFLYGCSRPTLVVLSLETDQHAVERRVIKSYLYEPKAKDVTPAPQGINVDPCEAGASHIIATEQGGLIVLAEESITYYSPGQPPSQLRVSPWNVTATCVIESTRFLVGDLDGGLWCLLLNHANGAPMAASSSRQGIALTLHLEYLGRTSIAHKLQYIDSGFVMVGSIYGDSQLIQMSTTPIDAKNDDDDEGDVAEAAAAAGDAMDESEGAAAAAAAASPAPRASSTARPNYLQVRSTFPNLGSIVGMAAIDLDRSGQCQLMTCSGAYKDGWLRVIRNGIGINEVASIELEGIQGVWGIRGETGDEFHRFLLQTYASETRVLALEQEQEEDGEAGEMALAECEIAGFDANQRTLFAGNMGADLLVQVTQESCRLVDSQSMQLVDEFRPAGKITLATGNTQQLLIASGKQVMLLSLNGKKLQQQAQAVLDEEISCMDISPLGGGVSASFAAICMWRDNSARIFRVPSLEEVGRDRLGDMLARSVLLVSFDKMSELDAGSASNFLLCGLGDGSLVSFEFAKNTGALSAKKKIVLGTSGLELSSFRSRGELHVFVCCDRPTVISNAHGKLRFSNVNLKDLTHMTPFHAPVFLDCLALVSGSELSIGRIDAIQKLHVTKVRTQGHARRLAHQKHSRTLAVSVITNDSAPESRSGEKCVVKLYDEQNFAKLDELVLERDEMVQSIRSLKLNISGTASAPKESWPEFFVLGTAFQIPTDPEPLAGRMLVLQVDTTNDERRKLKVVCACAVKGGVMSVDAIQGRVVAAINARVAVYRCVSSALQTAPGEFLLQRECTVTFGSFLLGVQTSADQQYVLCYDLLKSVSVLLYEPELNTNGMQSAADTAKLEEVAKDYSHRWLTAMESMPPRDELILATDHHFNLITLQRRPDATTEDERCRLDVVGQWHLGESVNAIVRGSLVMNLPVTEGEAQASAGHNDAAAAPASSSAVSTFSAASDRVIPTHIMGSISGALTVLAPLSHSAYRFFAALESALESVVRGVGGLSHAEWRAFQDDRRAEDSKAVIDGDLIELFLELAPKQQEAIANKVGVRLQECIKRVEDVSRIH